MTFTAVLFDLDGVITPTADLHRDAWRAMFTDVLADRGVDPYSEQDYFDHLDGRSRTEGVASLLASRGITLPHDRADAGEEGEDSPEDDTVVGLGLRKNREFLRLLDAGITPYPGSVRLLDALEDGAEEVTADTTKAVDTYTYSHVFLLEVLLCSSCFVSKPTHLLAPIHNRH